MAANFLGLAEIRLASGDRAGALDLLHRLALAIGNPFENLDPAASLLEKTGHHTEAAEFLDQLVKSAPWDASYRLRLAKEKLAANVDVTAATDSLSAIASSPGTSYDLRLQAARALGGRGHSDLGSAELNLLSGTGTVTASSADKFYFYEARIRAAGETADSQVKIQLLSHSIIDFPRRNPARVPLFQAAQSARSYSYAIAVVEPLLQSQFRWNDAPENANEDEQIASSGDEAATGSDLNPPETEGQLSREQRAELSEKIADVMMKLDRPADALLYYQRAREAERRPAARKALNHKIAGVQAQLHIEQQNGARQPLLHEALEQDRVVRPKVATRTGPADRATAAGGRRP